MTTMFILGRILFGGYFIMNGYKHFKHLKNMAGYAEYKKIPFPKFFVIFTGLLLVYGGLGIVLGGWMQSALIALILFLVPTTFLMHQYWKETDPMKKMGEEINFYKNLALLGAVLMISFIPIPWIISLM